MGEGVERVSRGVILIVDDNANLRSSLGRLLQEFGYQVESAAEGGAALSLLSQGLRPHLILLDLQMPGLDGWATCEILQADPTLRAIPVIVTSGLSPGKLPTGCRAMLEKPIDPQRLQQVLDQHLPAVQAA